MHDSVKLTDLVEPNILKRLQDSFAKMARMAGSIGDSNGIPLVETTNYTEFCNLCRSSEKGLARCQECDRTGASLDSSSQSAISYKCYAGLNNFSAPICLGDTLLGLFVGGQVTTEPLDEATIRNLAKEIDIDEDVLWEAATKVQVVPQAAVDRSVNFIYDFGKVVSVMAQNAYDNRALSEIATQAAIQKQDFLANMSHEIRTPMNAVMGMAEMALREEMSPEARDYIHQIQASGKHLLVIINDILDFSKIDSGKMEIVETLYETEELILELANLVNSRIGSKNIEFIIDEPGDLPREMYGDSIRIQQILINLLNNAVKFTSEGKITLKLRYEAIDEKTIQLFADVIDTGNGIKKEDLAKLFGSFQQVDSKRNRSVEGTGLGLAISKKLAELMGGSISVESEYGVGSTFSISIPQKVQRFAKSITKNDKPLKIYCMLQNTIVKEQLLMDLSDINAYIIDLTESENVPIDDGGFVFIDRAIGVDNILQTVNASPNVNYILLDDYDAPNDIKLSNVTVLKKPAYKRSLLAALGLCEMRKRGEYSEQDLFSFIAPDAKVLIVDDNSINLTVAKGLLEPLQMQIDTATGASECVDLAKKQDYDLIFMDHMMPGVDGVETTHILRRMVSGYEQTPIIALTANAVGGAKEMFLAEGMNDMVAKPIEVKSIISKVREWLPVEKIVPVDSSDITVEQQTSGFDTEGFGKLTGLDAKAGLLMLGSEQLYLQFLKQYYLDIDSKVDVIRKSLETEDYKTYTINVHALKSASRQIGAVGLGELAAKLEKAGNEGNVSFIKFRSDHLIADYLELSRKLETAYPEWREEKENSKISLDSLKDCLIELRDAFNDFDILTIDEIFEKVKSVEGLSDSENDMLEALATAHDEYDMDKCIEIVQSWLDYLEG